MGVVSSVGVVDDDELAKESEDVKENVKRKFLVQMPEDFYQFWDFCKSLNPSNPQGLCVAIRLGRVAQTFFSFIKCILYPWGILPSWAALMDTAASVMA